jgi:hypothetical protein
MSKKNGTAHGTEIPFDRFKALAGKLVRVPNKEVDAKEALYQRKKTRRKARKSD